MKPLTKGRALFRYLTTAVFTVLKLMWHLCELFLPAKLGCCLLERLNTSSDSLFPELAGSLEGTVCWAAGDEIR